MTISRSILIKAGVVGILGITLTGALAGCSSGAVSGDTAGAGQTPTTQTAPHTPSLSPTSNPTPSSTTSTTPTATAATTAAPSNTFRSGTCAGAVLSGAVASAGGGAAGSTGIDLVVKNASAKACTLQGWAGVSFVGHGNGSQIGAAAVQNRSSAHPTVTLPAGGSARIPVKVADALNYPTSTCKPVTADGFRVYPPGSKTALFVKATGFRGCSNTSVKLLTVSGVLSR